MCRFQSVRQRVPSFADKFLEFWKLSSVEVQKCPNRAKISQGRSELKSVNLSDPNLTLMLTSLLRSSEFAHLANLTASHVQKNGLSHR